MNQISLSSLQFNPDPYDRTLVFGHEGLVPFAENSPAFEAFAYTAQKFLHLYKEAFHAYYDCPEEPELGFQDVLWIINQIIVAQQEHLQPGSWLGSALSLQRGTAPHVPEINVDAPLPKAITKEELPKSIVDIMNQFDLPLPKPAQDVELNDEHKILLKKLEWWLSLGIHRLVKWNSNTAHILPDSIKELPEIEYEFLFTHFLEGISSNNIALRDEVIDIIEPEVSKFVNERWDTLSEAPSKGFYSALLFLFTAIAQNPEKSRKLLIRDYPLFEKIIGQTSVHFIYWELWQKLKIWAVLPHLIIQDVAEKLYYDEKILNKLKSVYFDCTALKDHEYFTGKDVYLSDPILVEALLNTMKFQLLQRFGTVCQPYGLTLNMEQTKDVIELLNMASSRSSMEAYLNSQLPKEKHDFIDEIVTKTWDHPAGEVYAEILADTIRLLISHDDPHGDLLHTNAKYNLLLKTFYNDYPAGYARALLKIFREYKALPSEWFEGVCIAFGKLRESLGGKVPKLLGKAMGDNSISPVLRERAKTTKELFNREHQHNIRLLPAKRRVRDAREVLFQTYRRRNTMPKPK